MLTLCLPAAGIQEVEAVAIWRGDVVRKKGGNKEIRLALALAPRSFARSLLFGHFTSCFTGTRHVVVLAPNLYKYYS